MACFSSQLGWGQARLATICPSAVSHFPQMSLSGAHPDPAWHLRIDQERQRKQVEKRSCNSYRTVCSLRYWSNDRDLPYLIRGHTFFGSPHRLRGNYQPGWGLGAEGNASQRIGCLRLTSAGRPCSYMFVTFCILTCMYLASMIVFNLKNPVFPLYLPLSGLVLPFPLSLKSGKPCPASFLLLTY